MHLLERYKEARQRLLDYFGAEQQGHYSEVIDMTNCPWTSLQTCGKVYVIHRGLDAGEVPFSHLLLPQQLEGDHFPPGWAEALRRHYDEHNLWFSCFQRAHESSKLCVYAVRYYTMFHAIVSVKGAEMDSFMIFSNELYCHTLEDLIQAVLRGELNVEHHHTGIHS